MTKRLGSRENFVLLCHRHESRSMSLAVVHIPVAYSYAWCFVSYSRLVAGHITENAW